MGHPEGKSRMKETGKKWKKNKKMSGFTEDPDQPEADFKSAISNCDYQYQVFQELVLQ